MTMSATPSLPIPNAAACSAECFCPLPDGRLLRITATRRPRANRAEVKCVAAGAPMLSERMQEVVRLARHTEALFDSREQVVLSLEPAPPAGERGWELAAVLADRMVRGVWQAPAGGVAAYGWSDAWHLGRLDGGQRLANAGRQPKIQDGCQLVLGGSADVMDSTALQLSHIGALHGHADPAGALSSARAWFPLHSGGINDSLAWVEVCVRPLQAEEACEEEDTIAAPGLDLTAQQAVRQALGGARHFDGRALGRWRTVVRFSQTRFQGSSYQLALVMADRLARGREFVPRGRLIASGCSAAWHAGRVDTVEGREAKMELILRQAAPGDRVLLPHAWRQELEDAAYAELAGALKAKGASLACIERIGLI
ncbi:hypothetical protein [Massilia sp. YIM B04103]|uniref:hypothetical protein n=1 Tax=Massilia sp. YIM B04103 TaxID=2963106 RepID=UPI00210AF0AF|nr:hypothetical protein [Massilia sp. YIM B04103]